jgi:hypothetical protein
VPITFSHVPARLSSTISNSFRILRKESLQTKCAAYPAVWPLYDIASITAGRRTGRLPGVEFMVSVDYLCPLRSRARMRSRPIANVPGHEAEMHACSVIGGAPRCRFSQLLEDCWLQRPDLPVSQPHTDVSRTHGCRWLWRSIGGWERLLPCWWAKLVGMGGSDSQMAALERLTVIKPPMTASPSFCASM